MHNTFGRYKPYLTIILLLAVSVAFIRGIPSVFCMEFAGDNNPPPDPYYGGYLDTSVDPVRRILSNKELQRLIAYANSLDPIRDNQRIAEMRALFDNYHQVTGADINYRLNPIVQHAVVEGANGNSGVSGEHTNTYPVDRFNSILLYAGLVVLVVGVVYNYDTILGFFSNLMRDNAADIAQGAIQHVGAQLTAEAVVQANIALAEQNPDYAYQLYQLLFTGGRPTA